MSPSAELSFVPWTPETSRIVDKIESLAPKGIFATGIENSDPFVDGQRRNQLTEAYDFPAHIEERIENIAKLKIKWLRFGVGYSLAHPEPDKFDFALTDQVVALCKKHGITLIGDLLHFGLPDWLHQDRSNQPFFQNPDFPARFAEYTQAYAERYPEIRYFTPVNEPMVTGKFSAKDGFWNEKIATEGWDHRPYVRALANIAKAAILAKKAIREVWRNEKREGEPLFFQNESFEFAIAAHGSGRQDEVNAFNSQRCASTDLIFGYHDEQIRHYLVDEQELPQAEYDWLMKAGDRKQTILGIDYYPWCIYRIGPDGVRYPSDPHLAEALFILIPDYYKRYEMPLMHMEINATPDRALSICQHTYDALSTLRSIGYPILGMSWFGDDLQVGWQSQMRGAEGFDEFRVGLFYKGEKEPVGELFSKLAKKGFNPIKKAPTSGAKVRRSAIK